MAGAKAAENYRDQWDLTWYWRWGIYINPNLNPVFSIRKSLQVLQKAHIKFVARAIYIYRFFFFYIHSSLLRQNKKLLWLLFSLAN